MKTVTKGILALLTSSAIYGCFGILIQMMGEEMSVINQIILRYLVAVTVMFVLLFITKPKLKAPRRFWPILFILAVVMQLTTWSFTKGAVYTSIPSLLGSFYIGSIMTSTWIGIFVFKERPMFKNWVGTVLVVLGLYALAQSTTNTSGLIYGLIAGGLESVGLAFRKYLVSVSRGVIVLVSLLGVLGVSVLTMWVGEVTFTLPHNQFTWIAAIVFAILVVSVNFMVTYGFRIVAMGVGSVIMSFEVFFGMLFSVIMFATKPTDGEIMASVAVVLSLAIQNLVVTPNNKILCLARKMMED